MAQMKRVQAPDLRNKQVQQEICVTLLRFLVMEIILRK